MKQRMMEARLRISNNNAKDDAQLVLRGGSWLGDLGGVRSAAR